ncbi:hypothetical protein [Metallosphaera hakonensis]|uniref:Uncharacterized protein n=1 Tax=Metallosphaera hakonensis JCM 8857 = DSM 7519 TaxID=1293036 RepID=A0A2U9IS49_9CREN|nr:hypothetical protein [Metallosphaera hakonensis]AWR98870.1 hypothetical protein DFR87_03235 [Metallosphaera hakonensis JCM 8857 = DSM 7519]
MKLSFETLEKLLGSGKYHLLTDDETRLVYYPPDIGEASGEEGGPVRIMEITLKKEDDGYEIVKGLVKENEKVVKEISRDELELWLQFIEG